MTMVTGLKGVEHHLMGHPRRRELLYHSFHLKKKVSCQKLPGEVITFLVIVFLSSRIIVVSNMWIV